MQYYNIIIADEDMEFVVVESYKAVNSDEVSVAKGDLIRVLSSPSTGWWMIKWVISIFYLIIY